MSADFASLARRAQSVVNNTQDSRADYDPIFHMRPDNRRRSGGFRWRDFSDGGRVGLVLRLPGWAGRGSSSLSKAFCPAPASGICGCKVVDARKRPDRESPNCSEPATPHALGIGGIPKQDGLMRESFGLLSSPAGF